MKKLIVLSVALLALLSCGKSDPKTNEYTHINPKFIDLQEKQIACNFCDIIFTSAQMAMYSRQEGMSYVDIISEIPASLKNSRSMEDSIKYRNLGRFVMIASEVEIEKTRAAKDSVIKDFAEWACLECLRDW